MVWVTALKKIRKQSELPGLHWHLLLSYLVVMAATLGVFATGAYWFFSRSLHQQLDEKLRTLAQAAAPSLAEIERQGSEYVERVDEVPWRDIFNRDRQSLEWFDATGQRVARRGEVSLDLAPQPGAQTIRKTQNSPPVRTYTISVYTDVKASSTRDTTQLRGFIRASQSTETLETTRSRLLWGLGTGGAIAISLAGVGSLWLTRKALKPVEHSLFQLQQFTADASHELRSPLTAIKTSVDVILSHPERIHPKDARKLAAISSATVQMNYLVEDLLFLARNDTPTPKRDRIYWQPVTLNLLLQELIELLEPSASAKNIALLIEMPIPLLVLGDKSQLTRLFTNLLDNAIQYTPEGGSVFLSLAKQNRFAVANIRDTGIGIAPEHLPLIFDRFWRADKARSRRHGGSGLGLSIAHAIAQRHGGKIIVTSSVGRGSCFQVRLPRVVSTVTIP
jgi:OmpR-family two-component system manganese-sensing sensor histidine kinase